MKASSLKFLKNTTGSPLVHTASGEYLSPGYNSVDNAILFRYDDSQMEGWFDDGSIIYAEADDGTFDFTDKNIGWNRLFDRANTTRNIYVAKSGDDTHGDGTLNRPFLTINGAITFINANYTLSASTNAVIIVAAGEYTEDTIVLPEFCSIWGHHYRTRVKHSTGLDDLIQSSGSHTIRSLLLTGVTDASKYLIRISTTSAKRVTLQDLSLSTYEAEGAVANGVYITSTTPTTTVRMKQIDFDDVDGNLIYLDQNVKTVVRGVQIFTCPTGTFINANNNSCYSIFNVDLDAIDTGIDHKNTGESELSNVNLLGATDPFNKANSGVLFLRSVNMNTLNAHITNYQGMSGYFIDQLTGDNSLRSIRELTVGTSDRGAESVFGEGDSYVIGMNVYTSDGTDTSTTEGSLTDVTAVASNKGVGTFSFEGISADYCIYVCTDVQNSAFGLPDYARIMGIKVSQTIACVEPTEKSIIFESWNGSAWVEGSILVTESSLFHRYSNDAFIRANSSEHIRFGRDLILLNNVKKTVASKERHWIRLRIKTAVTTAPVFDQFKISNNRTEINADGTMTFHGLSRYIQSLSFQSNTFGETGGVTNGSLDLGGGGVDLPHDNWTHSTKNNQLNGDNDAIYANAIIPEGCCTSCPVVIKIKYVVIKAGTQDGLFKVSAYVSRAQGVPVADRTGSITPIPRPASYCQDLDTGLAQIEDIPISVSTTKRLLTAVTGEFDIDDYYEGDIIFFRIGLDNAYGSRIVILGVDLEYVKWTLGSRVTS